MPRWRTLSGSASLYFVKGTLRPQLDSPAVCFRCIQRLSRNCRFPSRRPFGSSGSRSTATASSRLFGKDYFSAYRVSSASACQFQQQSALQPSALSPEPVKDHPVPHAQIINNDISWTSQPGNRSNPKLTHRRRHQRVKSYYDLAAEPVIPPDASSRLSTLSNSLPPRSLRRLLSLYLSLSKPRLTSLIVLTTAAAYSLYPAPELLLPFATTPSSLSTLTLVFLTSGTALCSASANALNMLMEPEHDAKMSRTRNRVLVRGLIGRRGALVFAALAGLGGVGGLWFGVNPTVAFLGGFNIWLYAGVYTPLKRLSVLNTWVGAVVGGIPPLMGWTAAAGQSANGDEGWRELLFGQESVGGWLLAALLFAWQFPHFNALSWTIRDEYKQAGYRMLAWTNSRMNGRVAFRYTLWSFPICGALWYFGITDQGFLVTSSLVNAWIVREAWRFWRKDGQRGSARNLFWAGVWHLPVLMVLAMAHKQGLWEGVWQRLNGETPEEKWMEEEEEKVLNKDKGIRRILKPHAKTIS